jgi:glutamate synthase (ferredoxin)
MTGGKVVVLGSTGYNFAAGMSGGTAYVFDVNGDFDKRCNQDMVSLGAIEDKMEQEELRCMIEKHKKYTDSKLAEKILLDWQSSIKKFVKVLPLDYKEMLNEIERAKSEGYEGDEVVAVAFERKVSAK